MAKHITKAVIPLGFILEVSLFVTSGYLIGRDKVYLGILIGLFGFGVALFVGELIRRKI